MAWIIDELLVSSPGTLLNLVREFRKLVATSDIRHHEVLSFSGDLEACLAKGPEPRCCEIPGMLGIR